MIKQLWAYFKPSRKQLILAGIAIILIIGGIVDYEDNYFALLAGVLMLAFTFRGYVLQRQGWKGRPEAPHAARQAQPDGQSRQTAGGYYQKSQQPPQQEAMTVTIPTNIPADLEWHKEELTPDGRVLQIAVKVKPTDETSDPKKGHHTRFGGEWR